MDFNFLTIDMINILFLAGGLGVSFLCLLLILASTHMLPKLRQYYIIFFSMLFTYIATHLFRELMAGHPGNGLKIVLYIVTFAGVMAAGLLAHMISMLVLYVAQPDNPSKRVISILNVLLTGHALILIIGVFLGNIYYFDAANEYHRGGLYLLSNLGPFLMLVIDAILLVRYKDVMDKRLRGAFWFYIVLPIIAVVIQGAFYGLQLIIFATLIAAVYAFFIIVRIQDEEMEQKKMENSRIETELSLATRIQEDMLPSLFPAFPDREEFDLFASMTPAKEVGGDFYDFFMVDDDHLAFVIADVAGKGIPAAMFMMFSKNIIANNVMLGKSPAKALFDSNNAICANNSEEMFVTVWLGILTISTGKLLCANAGHEYPVIKNGGDKFELLKDKHGMAVGWLADVKYTEYELSLSPGDRVFVYTDGVPEATAVSKEMYGTSRIVDVMNEDTSATPEQMITHIWNSVGEFVYGAEQFDDLTMLALEYKGKRF